MAKVKDIYKTLALVAPPSLKMDFDNVGFLVGFSGNSVTKLLVSLDITDEVVDEAVREGAQLIVSHHPLFFSLKSVTDEDRTGRKITALLSHGISAVCMHTNLDAAWGGVNDTLAKTAGLTQVMPLGEDVHDEYGQPYSYGRFGFLEEPVGLSRYLLTLKQRLGASGLRFHNAGRDVHKVAVVGGSGGGELGHAAARGCDTFLTADIKYDVFLEAKELGVNLIDGDHFCTENVVTPVLAERLRPSFPDIDVFVSKSHRQTAEFFI
jgi:dinuclear metal center YbgI/SA1388 family protein